MRRKKQPVFSIVNLTSELKDEILALPRKFRDVFAWTYVEILGLVSHILTHKINIKEGTKPVKQAPRQFKLELEIQIKQEIQKLLDFDFIKPIQHPAWLAHILPVKKKNGQMMCCIDFRDLNKACPKDKFRLPNIDMQVDVAVGHSIFSFMD